MGKRGNLFAGIEREFINARKEEISEIALNELRVLVNTLDSLEFDDRSKLYVTAVAAKLGVAGNGDLKESEKELIDEVFGPVCSPLEPVYDLISGDVEDSDYEMVERLNTLGNTVAMPLLRFILSFAYIDGEIEDEKAEKLESLFGMNLLAGFFTNDEEDVPASTPGTDDLEDEIVAWFLEDDTLHTLTEIKMHFSNRSSSDIQEALDSLVEKGIIYGGENIIGNMYGLA